MYGAKHLHTFSIHFWHSPYTNAEILGNILAQIATRLKKCEKKFFKVATAGYFNNF